MSPVTLLNALFSKGQSFSLFSHGGQEQVGQFLRTVPRDSYTIATKPLGSCKESSVLPLDIIYSYIYIYTYINHEIIDRKFGSDQDRLGFQAKKIRGIVIYTGRVQNRQVGKHNSTDKDLW